MSYYRKLIDQGRCPSCAKRLLAEGKKTCTHCGELRRAQGRRYYKKHRHDLLEKQRALGAKRREAFAIQEAKEKQAFVELGELDPEIIAPPQDWWAARVQFLQSRLAAPLG